MKSNEVEDVLIFMSVVIANDGGAAAATAAAADDDDDDDVRFDHIGLLGQLGATE